MNRVVTGFDETGAPVIIRQGQPPTVIYAGRYTTTELWVTGSTPPAASEADTTTSAWALEPPPGGTCFRIVEIAPGDPGEADDLADAGTGGAGTADAGKADASTGGAGTLDAEGEGFQAAHATATLDYVTVLSGQVTLVVGDAEVTLGPGDSVVQQPGVPHDWQNRTSQRVVMAGVLLSARA